VLVLASGRPRHTAFPASEFASVLEADDTNSLMMRWIPLAAAAAACAPRRCGCISLLTDTSVLWLPQRRLVQLGSSKGESEEDSEDGNSDEDSDLDNAMPPGTGIPQHQFSDMDDDSEEESGEEESSDEDGQPSGEGLSRVSTCIPSAKQQP